MLKERRDRKGVGMIERERQRDRERMREHTGSFALRVFICFLKVGS